MAISKVKFPDNSTQDIHDARVSGIDSSPTASSTNIVTSGGVYSALGNKQDTLVSGTNIKTINSQSLLGSGNITISGGGGGEENVIESISVKGTPQTIVNKNVDLYIPEEITSSEFTGSMYRSNVSGSGNISIQGVDRMFPTVPAGTYIIKTYSTSSTQSYTLNVSFGGQTYSLSTTEGLIIDTRTLTFASSATWSASITTVASGTILSVKVYAAGQVVTTVGAAAVSNDYNDLDNLPGSLPAVASGDAGKFLAVTGTGGTYQWDKVDWIHGTSAGVEVTYGTNLHAVGSLGQTMIYSGGINHDSFTDWSWITRGSGNNPVTLQDTLDAIGLPSVSSNDFGSMLYVCWDSTKGYYWEKSAGSFGPTFISNVLSCGYNCSFSVYGSFGSTYVTTEGISKSDYSDWTWIKTTYNNGVTDVTKTLQSDLDLKAPLASPALTGTPTAPTASSGTNTTQIATTAFVHTALSGKQNTITVSTSEPTSGQGSNGDIWIVV